MEDYSLDMDQFFSEDTKGIRQDKIEQLDQEIYELKGEVHKLNLQAKLLFEEEVIVWPEVNKISKKRDIARATLITKQTKLIELLRTEIEEYGS